MKRFVRAEDVFRDLPEDIKTRIWEMAAGRLVYFPKRRGERTAINKEEVLREYAQGRKSYEKIRSELGVSKVRVCQIINEERRQFSRERTEYWKKKGLSLRDIAKLFKKSHETVR